MTKYEGQIQIGKKVYKVAVIDGQRFIDGKTPEEFLETLSDEDRMALVKLGMIALNDTQNGEYCKHPKKYEYLINDCAQLNKEIKKLPPLRLF